MRTPRQILQDFQQRGTRPALAVKKEQEIFLISYHELAHRVLCTAHFFYHQLRLRQNDTVSYIFENSPEIIILHLTCFLTGLRSCPLDIKRETPQSAHYKLRETKAKVLLYRNSTVVKKIITSSVKDLKLIDCSVSSYQDFIDITGEKEYTEVTAQFSASRTALVLYTSGTTGLPKGALLRYENLYCGALQVKEWFRIVGTDTFYIVLPLHHVNSTVFALATLFAGGEVALVERYSKSNFFTDCAQFKATMSSIVPAINLDLLEVEEVFKHVKNKLRLKRIQIGSAPVSAQQASAFVKKYDIPLIQGYGSTETSLRVTGVPVSLPKKTYWQLLQENSIGAALSENEVELVDKKGAIVNKPGILGEIIVKGNNVVSGYLNREEENKKTFKNGYFHTGDMGYFKYSNHTKVYFLTGRIKEIIIKGGINISPLYVEEQLRAHVSWAREVIVVGFPHYRFGEEVGVVFIPKNQNYTKDFIKTKQELLDTKIPGLSTYETPQAAIVLDEKNIPRTATGKVQRGKMRTLYASALSEAYSYIDENSTYVYRRIMPEENKWLAQAEVLHNSVFPTGLHVTKDTLYHRSVNGFVIGGFHKNTQKLESVLTGFFANESLIEQEGTWSSITGDGSFSRARTKGKVAILASAASLSSRGIVSEVLKPPRPFTTADVQRYIKQERDFVVRFHHSVKAGFKKGARVKRIILNGNPSDKQSRGVVVIFEYPPLSVLQKPRITSEKAGFALVEAAIIYAQRLHKKKVVAFSRLGELYKYF